MNDYCMFIENYNEVFSEDGKIKVCGREACKRLIETAYEINPNVDYGNKQTGFMNVESLKALKASLI